METTASKMPFQRPKHLPAYCYLWREAWYSNCGPRGHGGYALQPCAPKSFGSHPIRVVKMKSQAGQSYLQNFSQYSMKSVSYSRILHMVKLRCDEEIFQGLEQACFGELLGPSERSTRWDPYQQSAYESTSIYESTRPIFINIYSVQRYGYTNQSCIAYKPVWTAYEISTQFYATIPRHHQASGLLLSHRDH